jgi:hypothetical protein
MYLRAATGGTARLLGDDEIEHVMSKLVDYG